MMDEAAAAATVVCVVSAKCCAAVGGALHLPSPPQPLPGPSITLTCSMVSAGLLAPPAPSHGTRSTNSLFFAKSSSPCLVLRQRSAHPRPLKQARPSGNQPPPLLAPVPPLLLLLLRLSTEACSPSVLVSPEVDSGLHPAGGSTSRCPFPRVEAPAGLGWAGLAGNRKGVSVASSPTLLDSHARQTHSRSAFSFSGLPPSRQPLPPSVPTSLLSLSLSRSVSYSLAGSPPPARATQTHTGSLGLGRANESKYGRESWGPTTGCRGGHVTPGRRRGHPPTRYQLSGSCLPAKPLLPLTTAALPRTNQGGDIRLLAGKIYCLHPLLWKGSMLGRVVQFEAGEEGLSLLGM